MSHSQKITLKNADLDQFERDHPDDASLPLLKALQDGALMLNVLPGAAKDAPTPEFKPGTIAILLDGDGDIALFGSKVSGSAAFPHAPALIEQADRILIDAAKHDKEISEQIAATALAGLKVLTIDTQEARLEDWLRLVLKHGRMAHVAVRAVYGQKMPEDLTDALTAYIKRVQADEQAELDRRKVAMARMEREPLVGAFAVGAHTCIMKFKPSVGIWTTWTPDLPAGMPFKKWFTPKQMDHYRRGRDEFSLRVAKALGGKDATVATIEVEPAPETVH